MKKQGFTLAEILITLGIVGIVAAITIPGFVARRPSENKLKLLKAHSALTSIVSDLVSDDTIYYQAYADDENGNPTPLGGQLCHGLDCRGQLRDNSVPESIIGNNTNAIDKFAILLHLRLTTNNDFVQNVGGPYTFTTTDGTAWRITSNNDGNNVATVTIDVNEKRNINNIPDPDNRNCSFGQNGADCGSASEMVDRFVFNIDVNGGVIPDGPGEQEMLSNPSILDRQEILSRLQVLRNQNNINNQPDDEEQQQP